MPSDCEKGVPADIAGSEAGLTTSDEVGAWMVTVTVMEMVRERNVILVKKKTVVEEENVLVPHVPVR